MAILSGLRLDWNHNNVIRVGHPMRITSTYRGTPNGIVGGKYYGLKQYRTAQTRGHHLKHNHINIQELTVRELGDIAASQGVKAVSLLSSGEIQRES